jgi:hypothetical protein
VLRGYKDAKKGDLAMPRALCSGQGIVEAEVREKALCWLPDEMRFGAVEKPESFRAFRLPQRRRRQRRRGGEIAPMAMLMTSTRRPETNVMAGGALRRPQSFIGGAGRRSSWSIHHDSDHRAGPRRPRPSRAPSSTGSMPVCDPCGPAFVARRGVRCGPMASRIAA